MGLVAAEFDIGKGALDFRFRGNDGVMSGECRMMRLIGLECGCPAVTLPVAFSPGQDRFLLGVTILEALAGWQIR